MLKISFKLSNPETFTIPKIISIITKEITATIIAITSQIGCSITKY